jgi:hypothetical protein
MVELAIALQQRLLEAAKRELGPGGDALLRDIAQRSLGCPIEQISYVQLPALLTAIEREGPRAAGTASTAALAAELDRLRVHADADLGERLVRTMAQRLGPAAEPCLAYICSRLGLSLGHLDRTQLPLIAAVVEKDGSALLGPATARTVAAATEQARRMRPPGLVILLGEIAMEQAGPEGPRIVQEICRAHLSIELDEVDIEGIALLARAVERDGPERIGAARTAAFLSAMRHAVTDPGDALRARLLELATGHLGPAAPVFLKRVCAARGLPFEAVSYEHLMWLADVLQEEMAPVVGAGQAADFANGVRGLLPNPPARVDDPSATEEPAPTTKESKTLRGVRDVARSWLRA